MHPQPGEPKEFLVNPSHEVTTEDYAVIALVRGLNPGQSVLILAGNTTMGTQAAVEYVCHLNSVEALLPLLSVSENGHLKPFEAVIRVKVTRSASQYGTRYPAQWNLLEKLRLPSRAREDLFQLPREALIFADHGCPRARAPNRLKA